MNTSMIIEARNILLTESMGALYGTPIERNNVDDLCDIIERLNDLIDHIEEKE